MNDEKQPIRRAVQHTVGIVALRRLRRLVDAENAQERADSKWASRLGMVFLAIAILLLAWLITRVA